MNKCQKVSLICVFRGKFLKFLDSIFQVAAQIQNSVKKLMQITSEITFKIKTLHVPETADPLEISMRKVTQIITRNILHQAFSIFICTSNFSINDQTI